MGEEWKSGKGGLVKGPAILPAVISFCNLDVTKSVFWRALLRLGDTKRARPRYKLYAKALTESVDQIRS